MSDATGKIEELRALLKRALPFLDDYDDKGPPHERWQSEELIALIYDVRQAIEER